jgi:hypothetical protein
MKQERLPTRDVRENRFEREEKLGQAPETLPGKTLRDRSANTHGTTLRGPARRLKAVATAKGAPPVILPILASKTKSVHFCVRSPDAKHVCVAATFNGWSPTTTPLIKGKRDEWEVELELTPGTYEYRFVVDGIWQDDPLAKGSVPNPFGGQNSVVSV